VGNEVRGNYCTWNALDKEPSGTLSNGNLEWTAGSGPFCSVRGTFFLSTGKWYFEVTCPTISTGGPVGIGYAASSVALNVNSEGLSCAYFNYGNVNSPYSGGGATSSYTTGDIIGVAYDCDLGEIKFYKNGTLVSTKITGIPAGTSLAPFVRIYQPQASGAAIANFGQRAFAYPLSGFKALCTTNLPAPLVTKPNTVMDVLAYSGSGSSRTFTGFGFGPDLVWIKQRSGANNHRLYDAVRGATKALYSNLTNSEGTDSTGLTSFTSDGFTLGDGDQVWNASGSTYVAWTWDAGTSTVTNTQGSITSQCRTSVSSGFSVITYTGTGANATVGHGLGVAPGLVIAKNRTAAGNNWIVWITGFTGPQGLYLNSTSAQISDTGNFTAVPTSSVINLGSGAQTNGSTNSHLIYAWAPVSGYSSMGSYVGNGSSDGPFVYTGFRPRWILVRRTGADANWWIIDSARDTYNVSDKRLSPNLNLQEFSGDSSGGIPVVFFDILSNGFKVRSAGGEWVNQSGATYIYAAFAESPFQYARAR
jgi:hypothetical protein